MFAAITPVGPRRGDGDPSGVADAGALQLLQGGRGRNRVIVHDPHGLSLVGDDSAGDPCGETASSAGVGRQRDHLGDDRVP